MSDVLLWAAICLTLTSLIVCIVWMFVFMFRLNTVLTSETTEARDDD
jgi:hypothetical protein